MNVINNTALEKFRNIGLVDSGVTTYKRPTAAALPALTEPFTLDISTSTGDVFKVGIDNYPSNPIMHGSIFEPLGSNPNLSTRGKLVLFGSLTQKRRGIVGTGNVGYDKAFHYDRRLLSKAPPLFTSSTNMILKDVRKGGVRNAVKYYHGGTNPYTGGTLINTDPLAFLY
jgi:hypothetical protein